MIWNINCQNVTPENDVTLSAIEKTSQTFGIVGTTETLSLLWLYSDVKELGLLPHALSLDEKRHFLEKSAQTRQRTSFGLWSNNPDTNTQDQHRTYLINGHPTLLPEPQLPGLAKAEISEIQTCAHKTKTSNKNDCNFGELTLFI